MFDILALIPGKKRQASNGWYSFNAICCHHNGGHRPDTRFRGGIKTNGPNEWLMHCFNCNFTCSFRLGKPLEFKTKKLLNWLGVDDIQIQRWNLESLQYKDLLDFYTPTKPNLIRFVEKQLPEGELLDKTNPTHKEYVDYLINRCIDIDSYPFMVTPNDVGRNKHRVIVPYTYKNKIVGHTSRYLDNKTPRFINDQQPGYVFNIDVQHNDWSVCILTEGIFDALSIDGVALMHDDISDEQSKLLASLNRQIILVPDRDTSGLKLTDKALEFGYSVSLPKWETDIKDVNDAVIRYGKVPTLLSILQSATNSKIKIEMRKRQIAKGL